MLTTVLQNAIEACQKNTGKRRISILVDQDVESGDNQVTIIDNGSGIDAAAMQQLFSQGFTTKSQGKGFNLHNAANLARMMGGNLTAHSDGVGAGAAFTFSLPVTVAAVEA